MRWLKRRIGWLDLIASALVVAGGGLTVTKQALGNNAKQGALGLALAITGVLIGFGGRLLKWLREQLDRDRAHHSLLLTLPPRQEPWPPPSVDNVDPFEAELIVRSEIAERYRKGGQPPPYVRRDIDDTLDAALAAGQMVLVAGQSMAGKSRAAFEAAARMDSKPILVVPASPQALPQLLKLDPPLEFGAHPVLLWLDDIDIYLSQLELQGSMLSSWTQRTHRGVVLATITLNNENQLRNSETAQLRKAANTLDSMKRIELAPSSDGEILRAKQAYPHEEFETGIGEHFAALRELIARLRIGLASQPHGAAAVLAALDWWRVGVQRPLSQSELHALYPLCLREFSPLMEPTRVDFQAGLNWARQPVGSVVALLMPDARAKPSGLRTFSYLRDWADDSSRTDVDPRLRSVANEIWERVIDYVSPTEAASVAFAAEKRNNWEAAIKGWLKAANTDSKLGAAMALSAAAERLTAERRYGAAIATYEQILGRFGRSRQPELRAQVAAALVKKGAVLEELGEWDAAILTYDLVLNRFGQAAEPGPRESLAAALVRKGSVLDRLRQRDAAIATYDQVLERYSQEPEVRFRKRVADALLGKGIALSELGQRDAAMATYDQVLERYSQAPELELGKRVVGALINKGIELRALGDWDAAIAVYDQVLERLSQAHESDPATEAAAALVNRGVSKGAVGDSAAAIASYDQVVERFGQAPEPELRKWVATALVDKGITLLKLAKPDIAITTYDQVLDRYGQDPEARLREWVAEALVGKGTALAQLGELESAIAIYDQVLDRYGQEPESGLVIAVARALVGKGEALDNRGEGESAIALYDHVCDQYAQASEPQLRREVAAALFKKGNAMERLGRRDAAIATYEQVVERYGLDPDSAIHDWVARALINKGVALERLGSRYAAIAIYEQVIERYDPAREAGVRDAVATAKKYRANVQRSEDLA